MAVCTNTLLPTGVLAVSWQWIRVGSQFPVLIAHCTLQSLMRYSTGIVESDTNSDNIQLTRLFPILN